MMHEGRRFMRKIKIFLAVIGMAFVLTACGKGTNNSSGVSSQKEENHTPETTKTSPDKYTWYIKDYVGRNAASFGYTSMGGERMDEYGDGLLKIVFVNEDGSFIDISKEEELKKYRVVKQNIKPNTELKYTFEKDKDGEEYDSLIDSQTYEEIVLAVQKVDDSNDSDISVKEIKASPDKNTWYVRDYVGRNLAACGYLSMGGQLRDEYGPSTIGFVIIADDGSYIDVSDKEALKKYVVTKQNISPNTKLQLQLLKDENGEEYDSLVDSQNIEEIELYVTQVKNNQNK